MTDGFNKRAHFGAFLLASRLDWALNQGKKMGCLDGQMTAGDGP